MYSILLPLDIILHRYYKMQHVMLSKTKKLLKKSYIHMRLDFYIVFKKLCFENLFYLPSTQKTAACAPTK
jgi:hypothetical protein